MIEEPFCGVFLCCLRRYTVKKLLLIVNKKKKKNKSTAPLYDAIVRLCEGGYLVNVKETKASGDATRYALELGSYYDTVVC